VSQEISLPANEVGEGTRRAMQAIEAYLARHAFAADTEDGIVQWWLPEMGVDVPLIEARLALQSLVSQGRIERRSLPGGTVIYRAASPCA
jgi:hypothetical protein